MKQYWSISKKVAIEEPGSPFDQTLIVEYSSGAAVRYLQSILPHFRHASDPKVAYEISNLSTVCAMQVGNATTKSYLVELQNLAKLMGSDFAEVLKSAMSQIVTKLQPVLTSVKGPQGGEGKPPSSSYPVSSVAPPAATPSAPLL